MPKLQLNARVRPEVRTAVDQVCEKSGFTKDDFIETAIGVLFGADSKLVDAKRQLLVAAFKDSELNLSFKNLWPSLN